MRTPRKENPVTSEKKSSPVIHDVLKIQLDDNGITFSHCDNENVFNFKHFTVSSEEERIQILSSELNFFKDVKEQIIFLDSKKFLILSNQHADNDKLSKEFSIANEWNEEKEILCLDDLNSIHAHFLYTIPNELKKSFGKISTDFHLRSSAGEMIERFLLLHTDYSDRIFLYVQTQQMGMFAFNQGKFIFYNQFNYETPEDFIYYLLFSCEQTKMNPENFLLILCGQIEKGDAFFEIVLRFIRNVKLLSSQKNFSDKHFPPAHHYPLLLC